MAIDLIHEAIGFCPECLRRSIWIRHMDSGNVVFCECGYKEEDCLYYRKIVQMWNRSVCTENLRCHAEELRTKIDMIRDWIPYYDCGAVADRLFC